MCTVFRKGCSPLYIAYSEKNVAPCFRLKSHSLVSFETCGTKLRHEKQRKQSSRNPLQNKASLFGNIWGNSDTKRRQMPKVHCYVLTSLYQHTSSTSDRVIQKHSICDYKGLVLNWSAKNEVLFSSQSLFIVADKRPSITVWKTTTVSAFS